MLTRTETASIRRDSIRFTPGLEDAIVQNVEVMIKVIGIYYLLSVSSLGDGLTQHLTQGHHILVVIVTLRDAVDTWF